jgi:hypothetical protein
MIAGKFISNNQQVKLRMLGCQEPGSLGQFHETFFPNHPTHHTDDKSVQRDPQLSTQHSPGFNGKSSPVEVGGVNPVVNGLDLTRPGNPKFDSCLTILVTYAQDSMTTPTSESLQPDK